MVVCLYRCEGRCADGWGKVNAQQNSWSELIWLVVMHTAIRSSVLQCMCVTFGVTSISNKRALSGCSMFARVHGGSDTTDLFQPAATEESIKPLSGVT